MSNEIDQAARFAIRAIIDNPAASDEQIDAIIVAQREYKAAWDVFSQMRAAKRMVAAIEAAKAS